ncbi:hypothetical protein [Hyphomicrobium sp.]|uniref:hypothetical protein n=1 Tax=Hyphomicrobium sp. TaxID=82 RepID=UPI000FB90F9C|nr:hypothetical protein [Hyphomicrobium sp.]MBN9248392.1 hypothetical protein [Hyphomicrobium sp.]RUP10579.1 MAG: hypothetical protein EKK38_03395 [Hyphomicrobium sp.]
MKYVIASALAALALPAAATLAVAEDQSPPARHTFGDEGKLPPTGATTNRVPEMGAGTGQSTGTEGAEGRHRMGDEGKLPATNSMSKKVPEMTPNTENPGK